MRKLGSRYVLHEMLGQGTTGQVWRGAHVSGGPAVAIKVLRPELAHDPEIVDRFLREWDLLLELDSPDLVAVRDLVNESDVLAIVMDLVDGPDLRAHLQEFGPRPTEEAVRFAVGTLWALDSVHAAGIVHRDVKPENVLIDASDPDRPIVRLTDFGIARVVNTPARVSSTGPVGTPLYMAPELTTGAPPTPAADIYSAGVVLYELLAGSPPFDSAIPADLMRAHRESEPLPIQGVPPAVWDVLLGMLAKSPRQRPASAADAADDLVEALEADQRQRNYDGPPHDERAADTGAYENWGATGRATTAGTQRMVRPAAAAGAGLAGGAARGWSDRSDRSDLEHTQIAGSLPALSKPATGGTAGTGGGGWGRDAEHTQIAPATSNPRRWDDNAPTGIAPAVRVPARSGAPAADTNTIMSAIPANRQPGPGSSPSSSRAAADRRRRSRIAAGAGLVVALVAGAGGWALAAGGGNEASLTADGTVGVSSSPSAGDSSGLGVDGVGVPVASVSPTSIVAGAATMRPGAPGSPAPGRPGGTAPGGTTAPTTPPAAGASPSPTPTDDGTATVPNTVGTARTTAKNTLAAAGFTNISESFDCFDTGAIDQVMQQTPKAGKVAKTTTIKIVAQGNDCAQVPNVTGMTETQAKSTLSAAGFLFVNGECPKGYTSSVTSYTPNTGRHPAGSTPITLNLTCTAPKAPPTTAPPK